MHYSSAYREFDGIMVPTRRRVYVRNPDGSPVLDSVSIAIDVTFSLGRTPCALTSSPAGPFRTTS